MKNLILIGAIILSTLSFNVQAGDGWKLVNDGKTARSQVVKNGDLSGYVQYEKMSGFGEVTLFIQSLKSCGESAKLGLAQDTTILTASQYQQDHFYYMNYKACHDTEWGSLWSYDAPLVSLIDDKFKESNFVKIGNDAVSFNFSAKGATNAFKTVY